MIHYKVKWGKSNSEYKYNIELLEIYFCDVDGKS